LLGIAAAAFLAGGSARASDGVDPAWFPLRAGAEWVYEAHRDQTFAPDKAPINRALHVGRAVRTVDPDARFAPNGFRVREALTLRPVEGRADAETVTDWTVYSLGSELLVHATGDLSGQEIVYKKPLRLLPTTTPGQSWNAGTFRLGAQSAKVRGEVLGVEDLPGETRWKGLLAIRLAGEVSGSFPGSEPPAEIESGTFERRLWLARDVGIVREVTTLTMRLKLPDRHVRTDQVTTLRLLEHPGAP